MDPRQKEMFPEPKSLPEGVSKATPNKDRIQTLEFVLERLLLACLDHDVFEPAEKARLLSALAMLTRATVVRTRKVPKS